MPPAFPWRALLSAFLSPASLCLNITASSLTRVIPIFQRWMLFIAKSTPCYLHYAVPGAPRWVFHSLFFLKPPPPRDRQLTCRGPDTFLLVSFACGAIYLRAGVTSPDARQMFLFRVVLAAVAHSSACAFAATQVGILPTLFRFMYPVFITTLLPHSHPFCSYDENQRQCICANVFG